MNYKGIIKCAAVTLAVIVSGILYSCQNDNTAVMEITDKTTQVIESTLETTRLEQDVYVYVCGQVNKPGVYRLNNGSRICDAISAAGSTTDKAADTLNLAAFVSDGDKIYVPAVDETTIQSEEPSGDTPTGTGKININTADKNMLMTLSGIGEAKANAIISYRENNGPFTDISDIMNISGIKESAFSKIKDSISVN